MKTVFQLVSYSISLAEGPLIKTINQVNLLLYGGDKYNAMQNNSGTFFAPQLIISDCSAAIEFYKKAFGVVELRRWNNEDGTVHVAELSFDGCVFHIHEPTQQKQYPKPKCSDSGTYVTVKAKP